MHCWRCAILVSPFRFLSLGSRLFSGLRFSDPEDALVFDIDLAGDSRLVNDRPLLLDIGRFLVDVRRSCPLGVLDLVVDLA